MMYMAQSWKAILVLAFLLLLISSAYVPCLYGQTQKIEVEFEVLATVVCEGDETLWKMAKEHYGNAYLWPLIAYMNRLSEDTEIPVGTTIYIPVVEPKKAVLEEELTQKIEVEFEVLATVIYEGDKTLRKMAEEHYGKEYLWPLIAYMNRLSEDTEISAGTTIYIPVLEPKKAVADVEEEPGPIDEKPGPGEEESKSTEGEVKPIEEESEPTGGDSPDIEYLFQCQPVSDSEADDVEDKECQIVISEQAKKQLESGDASNEIIWSGEPYGCVRDFSQEVVYGFYPFWMADGSEQKLDFSVLSRIGYFAVPSDNSGSIPKRLHLTPKHAKFMKEAWRYGTAVDLVVYYNNWAEVAGKEAIDNLTTNIIDLLDDEIEIDISDWIEHYFSFGRFRFPTMGDGVTIFLDGYTEKDGESFIELIQGLREKLGYYKSLNIMLHMDAIGKGIYKFDNLRKIIPDENGGKDHVNLFLVFLDEPTTRTKKELRNNIEKGFKGIQRRNMLRKIVPVIPLSNFSTDKQQQFIDDLVYFEDNFGGVGFWPLPMGKDSDVNAEIRKCFQVESQERFYKLLSGSELLYNGYKWVHSIVYPNRWWFRIIFNILAAILLVYGLLCIWIFRLRVLFKKHFRYFLIDIIPLIVVVFISLMWDPYWKTRRDEVFVLLIFVSILIGLAYTIRNIKKADFP